MYNKNNNYYIYIYIYTLTCSKETLAKTPCDMCVLGDKDKQKQG